METGIKIAPSLLAADFARLAEAVQAVESAGADYVHIDVMDGHFVPNITVGPPVVHALRRATSLPLDVHLMIEKPGRYVPAFAKAGADILTIHVEATPDPRRILRQIRDLGVRPGITLNPATPVDAVKEVLGDVDLVLVMTVNPGFGGQHIIRETLDKLPPLRRMLDAMGNRVELEVDGGIDDETAADAVAAGATVLVAGEAIFDAAEGPAEGIKALRRAVQEGQRGQ